MGSRLALAAVPGHVSGVRTFSAKKTWPEWRRGNNVPRQDVPLRGGQIGGDRHIGIRHCAEHRLHGGRMFLHPFQAFAGINGERARRFLGASAVEHLPRTLASRPRTVRQASSWLGSGAMRASR